MKEDYYMTDEIRHLRFLAEQSKQNIEMQLGSYRQQHTYSGTIIGITFIFIPFFLSGLGDANLAVQLLSIVPVVLFFGSLLLLVSIFRSKNLDQAFIVDKFDELLKKSYKDTLLDVTERNSHAYHHNKVLAAKASKRYDSGIKVTIIAMMISIVLLLVNEFTKIQKSPIMYPFKNGTPESSQTNELLGKPRGQELTFDFQRIV